ncbi:MAG: hypothetical protein SFX19_00485 [Alphaproteobacteria bacterium]|nr:hypothetical protein [Alphaproteobacteria bacterium]
MRTLPQILKTWNLERRVLTSPPITDKKLYQQIKQLLIRSMIHADCMDTQSIIKISLNAQESSGKSNLERLERMNITW